MKLWRCSCKWSYVIGRKNVYGPIWPMGIGDFPDALSNTQQMMTRAQWEDEYSDCAARYAGECQHHDRDRSRPAPR